MRAGRRKGPELQETLAQLSGAQFAWSRICRYRKVGLTCWNPKRKPLLHMTPAIHIGWSHCLWGCTRSSKVRQRHNDIFCNHGDFHQGIRLWALCWVHSQKTGLASPAVSTLLRPGCSFKGWSERKCITTSVVWIHHWCYFIIRVRKHFQLFLTKDKKKQSSFS